MTITNQFFTFLTKDLPDFFKSRDFSKAILTGIAITTPIILGIATDRFEIGLALCFGAFWCSPSDVSGSFRHKKIGILFSAAMVVIITLVGGYMRLKPWLPLPVLGVFSFAIAYISVYGFRASLISFSGLLALILSFAHEVKTLEVWQYALLVGAGGLWYLLLAVLWQKFSHKAQTEEVLGQTYALTADFLETRGKLVGIQVDRKILVSHLHAIQAKLTEHHATLREILMLSRRRSGKSNFEGRRLLIFVQLVEMLETAIANPVNYDRMDAVFEDNPKFIREFQELIYEISTQLRLIAEWGNDPGKLPKNKSLNARFAQLRSAIETFGSDAAYSNYDTYAMLRNLLEYQEKQFSKLKKIKWLLGNTEISENDLIDRNVAGLFIASPDYDPKILLRNLSFRSNIFKHSLRLSVTLMVGFAVGLWFDSQTPYWILLTIIVIMRPGYGLTKKRSKDRIIGTLIGALMALGVVFLIQNPYIFGLLGIISLVVAFSMVKRNYKASATFVTLSVVFIYAITRPDILHVIQFRILDTFIGAAMSYIAMRWLWPAWGFLEIGKNIETSVAANKNFLGEIGQYYQRKGKVPISYKVTRKEAFLQTSNLSSAFQGMAQEPKSKQHNLQEIYELVELNHTFLSALASLSSYIQHHRTSEASPEFVAAIGFIDQNLEWVKQNLRNQSPDSQRKSDADESLFKNQLQRYEAENFLTQKNVDLRDYQEAHLVWEQLHWLYSLSAKMLKITSEISLT